MDRRRFLGVVGSTPLWFAACASGGTVGAPFRSGVELRDVHSGRSVARAARVIRPTTHPEVRSAIGLARREGAKVAVAGGMNAMGGQQMVEGGWVLDLTDLDRIVSFDSERGLVTVGAGNTWARVVDFLSTTWARDGSGWTVTQTADDAGATIGGSLASNVHGLALGRAPIVGDVEQFALIDDRGIPRIANRRENSDLFRLAIGGYGLFGPIVEVTLRLRPRVKVEKLVSEETVESAVQILRDRTVTGDLYGEFLLSVDEESYLDYLREGVLTTWRRVDMDVEIPPDQVPFTEEDWVDWMLRAHTDPHSLKRHLFEKLLDSDGQILWCDEIQLRPYRPGYHAEIEARSAVPSGSETIAEVFLPGVRVPDFMSAARAILRTSTTPVTRCAIRGVEPDEETFLAWARQRYACVEFELHVDDTHAGREVADATIRELIGEALERDGTFYLTYGRVARVDQVRTAYPQFDDFLRLKRQNDPREIFQSEWYRYWTERTGAA